MNNRERIINTILNKPVDRQPLVAFFGPWYETLQRWKNEGLTSDDWSEGLGLDPGFTVINVNLGYMPAFEYTVIEEKERTAIVRDSMGILQEISRVGSSIPRYIEYPVKNMDDWQRMKERLDPDNEYRFLENWNEIYDDYNHTDLVVQLGYYPYGVFGAARNLMGAEELLVAFYDDPELVHDIMDYLTDFWLKIFEKVCSKVKVDIIHMWEDMSGKQGSLISPNMIREFMVPNYKKIKAFTDKHDIPIFSVDTDGNCDELIPPFMEGGVNLLYPFEVAAGCDIVDYKERYPSLGMIGGIDKRALALGKEDIDKELDRIAPMFKVGGYIASLDHLIPPDISYSNFVYFIEGLKKRIF